MGCDQKKLYASVVVTPTHVWVPTQRHLVHSFMWVSWELFTLPLYISVAALLNIPFFWNFSFSPRLNLSEDEDAATPEQIPPSYDDLYSSKIFLQPSTTFVPQRDKWSSVQLQNGNYQDSTNKPFFELKFIKKTIKISKLPFGESEWI